MTDKLYPDLDPRQLDPQFCRHMLGLTAEGLHDKARIAEQLAWRDQTIERLQRENELLLERVCWSCGNHTREWFEAQRHAKPAERDTDTTFIQPASSISESPRAAEGVTLEPGEYEVVELSTAVISCGKQVRRGERTTVTRDLAPCVGGFHWWFTSESGSTPVVAVRRADTLGVCAGCGKPLLHENAWMVDGCPCNSPAGVNEVAVRRVSPAAAPEPVAAPLVEPGERPKMLTSASADRCECGLPRGAHPAKHCYDFKPGKPPVCSTCNDSHVMTLRRDGHEDRKVPCTRCPTPCSNCAQHSPGQARGAYCENTPFDCGCHEPADKGCSKHGNINCTHCLDARRLAAITKERNELRSKVAALENELRLLEESTLESIEKHIEPLRAKLTAAERQRDEAEHWGKIHKWCAAVPYTSDGGRQFVLTMEPDEEGRPGFTLCAFENGKVLAGFNGDQTLRLASEWCER